VEVTTRLPGVQRLKSPLEGFSPGVRLRGRRHGDRIGGRPARSVLSGAVSTARLSSYEWRVEQRPEVTPQAAGRSAIEIASGRLFAGRPPAWTPPRRPPMRSPGAKRPLRRGFNRTPEQQRQEVTPQAAGRSAIEIASGRLFAGRPPAWTPPRRPLRRSPGAKRPLRRGFNHTPEQQRQEVTPQAAGRSAIEIASGRLFAGRPPAWTLPRRPHRRSPGAKRPLRRGLWSLSK